MNKTNKTSIACRRANHLDDHQDHVTSMIKCKWSWSLTPPSPAFVPLVPPSVQVSNGYSNKSYFVYFHFLGGGWSYLYCFFLLLLNCGNKEEAAEEADVCSYKCSRSYCQEKVDVCLADFIHGISFSFWIVRYVIHFHFILQIFIFAHLSISSLLCQQLQLHSNDQGSLSWSNRLQETRLEEDRGELLKKNDDEYMWEVTTKLSGDVSVFGLWCNGNGATLMKFPLMNVLFSGKYFTFFSEWIINIIYSQSYLLLFMLLYRQLQAPCPYGFHWFHKALGSRRGEGCTVSAKADYAGHGKDQSKEKGKKVFEMVAFDGAAIVQKAGKIIEAKFLKVKVIKGVEHFGSLFISKCLDKLCLQLLKTFTKILNFVFV